MSYNYSNYYHHLNYYNQYYYYNHCNYCNYFKCDYSYIFTVWFLYYVYINPTIPILFPKKHIKSTGNCPSRRVRLEATMTLLPAAASAPQATDDKTSWLGDVGIAQGVPKKNDFDNP